MEALSFDLRQRIVAACDSGQYSKVAVAKLFSVSYSSVMKLLRRRRETGSIAALPRSCGRKAVIVGEKADQLRHLVTHQPDATLEELRKQLELSVDLSTIHYTLKRLGISYKKNTKSTRTRSC